jgi:hypothetical protein
MLTVANKVLFYIKNINIVVLDRSQNNAVTACRSLSSVVVINQPEKQ